MATLRDLALPSGQFAMVAMDQRESLATMLRDHGRDDSPETMIDFKLRVARRLGPAASGFLIDRELGFDRLVADHVLPEGCGLILAADELTQAAGGPVLDTAVDAAVDPEGARQKGVVALKLLVMWRADARRDARVAMTADFIAACDAAGLLSVVEPVAAPVEGQADFVLNDAILDAASALGPLRPDIYKAQVPDRGLGEFTELAAACARLDRQLEVPWVVLSNGVQREDFPRAVRAACAGGASGFLAGRALWSNALDVGGDLDDSARRLDELIGIVADRGRPWTQR
jgi:sulfofructosephosphate aldolase